MGRWKKGLARDIRGPLGAQGFPWNHTERLLEMDPQALQGRHLVDKNNSSRTSRARYQPAAGRGTANGDNNTSCSYRNNNAKIATLGY